MTLRLRRGTDLERQSITFQEGELVYITDTKDLYAGDGTTVGGIKVSNIGTPSSLTQNLNLNGYNIQGTGTISATSFVGDGSNLVNVPGTIVTNGNYTINIAGYVKTFTNEVMVDPNTKTLFGDFIGSHQGSLRADDSTLLVDANTGAFFGTFVGDGSLISNISIDQLDDVDINNPGIGEVLVFDGFSWTNSLVSFPEIVEGSDYKINIVGADSTIMVDYFNNLINASTVYTSNIVSSDMSVIPLGGYLGETAFNLNAVENRAILKFIRNSTQDISNSELLYGSIFFQRSDTMGSLTTGIIAGGKNGIFLLSDDTGVFPESATISHLSSNGNLGIGIYVPTEKLSVSGNAKVTGFVQFGSLTTIQRDALTAENGMVIYNTTDNKFQGYQNGVWINLDTGNAA